MVAKANLATYLMPMAKAVVKKKPKKPTKKAKVMNGLEIHEIFARAGASVPAEQIAKMPKDAAMNFEHYMYGLPKQSDPRY